MRRASRPRIILISNIDSPYVRGDVAILEDVGDTQLILYDGRKRLPDLLRSLPRADLVVDWFALGYATTSVLVARALHIPIVVIAGGWDVVAAPELGYGALLSPGRLSKTRIALRLANRVICVSEATREAVLRIVSRSLSVIPPGIDVSFFRPSGLERRAQVVCVAGVDNVVRYRVKGVDVLLRVASLNPEIPIYLVGPNTSEWERFLVENAPPNVHVLGALSRDELRGLFAGSRAYVQLSAYESFCVSLGEAMASGCVPVVSDRGALPEVVGNAGFVVPYGDVDGTSRAIREALERADLQGAARDRVVETFSLDRRREGLQTVVRSLL